MGFLKTSPHLGWDDLWHGVGLSVDALRSRAGDAPHYTLYGWSWSFRWSGGYHASRRHVGHQHRAQIPTFLLGTSEKKTCVQPTLPGAVQACGTGDFLKRKFGCGYVLTIVTWAFFWWPAWFYGLSKGQPTCGCFGLTSFKVMKERDDSHEPVKELLHSILGQQPEISGSLVCKMRSRATSSNSKWPNDSKLFIASQTLPRFRYYVRFDIHSIDFAVSYASRHARSWQRNSGQCPHATRAPTLYHPGRTCRKEGSE